MNAWKAHKLARNLKYDSFPRTGETCNAKSFFCFVKKLHEGSFSNQDACVTARAHHAAFQKLGCFDELCAVLAKGVGLLCVVHRRQHHFRDRARTLEHVALRSLGAKRQTSSSSARSLLACCISSLALALPRSPRHLQSLGMAQMSSVG